MALVLLLLALGAQLIKPPSPPYLGPAKWHGAADNKPLKRIVMHATAGSEPSVPGAARATVAYSKTTSRASSFHYVRDLRECFQYVYDSVVAYHDGTNSHSLGYELCCSLSNEGRGHWDQPDHLAMLKAAAVDVARLCLAYDVPIRKLSYLQVRLGLKGICGHNDMRLAYPTHTSHWDPSIYFPWDDFIAMVKAAAAQLQDHPDPVPPPPHPHKAKQGVVHLGWCNIKSVPLMTLDKVTHDIHAMLEKVQAIGWAEIQPEGYKNVLRSLPKPWLTRRVETTECPATIDTETFQVLKFTPAEHREIVLAMAGVGVKASRVGHGIVVTHGGIPLVTPHRVVTFVKVRERETGAVLVLVFTHYVSAAWSKRYALLKRRRKTLWNRHFTIESALVRCLVDVMGYSVFGAGDDNRGPDMPAFHPDQVWLSRAGIDHLYTVEAKGGTTFTGGHVEVVDSGLFTDHPGKVARIHLHPAA